MSQLPLSKEPITKSKFDRLGWSKYAAAIARAISNEDVSSSSSTISLTGEWGSGKSSLKNLVLENLGTDWERRTLEFAPWQIQGHEQIHQVFFRDLAIVAELVSSESPAKITPVLEKLAMLTGSGSHLFKLLPYFAVLIAASHGDIQTALATAATIPKDIATTLGAGLDEASKTLKSASEVPNDEEKTLDETRKQLREHFASLEAPILVVIDDLDRLAPEEIFSVIQLVKANCDFPNLIYLLLFQRDILENSLGRFFTTDINDISKQGRLFLQKIVQIPLIIPNVSSGKLSLIIKLAVSNAAARAGHSFADDNGQFDKEVTHICPLFKTLRSVQRFAEVFSFVLQAFGANDTLKLNFYDLLKMEALRFFEPDVHAFLRDHREWILNGSDYDHRELIIKKSSTNEMGEFIINLLSELFPATNNVKTNTKFVANKKLIEEFRLCLHNNLEEYFSLSAIFAPFENAEG